MNKKRLLIPLAALALFALASCDSKLCYCYERVSATQVYESEQYISSDTPCSSLSTENRGCIESYERGSIDPQDIAK